MCVCVKLCFIGCILAPGGRNTLRPSLQITFFFFLDPEKSKGKQAVLGFMAKPFQQLQKAML